MKLISVGKSISCFTFQICMVDWLHYKLYNRYEEHYKKLSNKMIEHVLRLEKRIFLFHLFHGSEIIFSSQIRRY